MGDKFIPPKKIIVLSDKNELTFRDTLKPVGSVALIYCYAYTKSKTKLGEILGLNQEDLKKFIKQNTP